MTWPNLSPLYKLTQLPTQEDKDQAFPPEKFAELSAPNPSKIPRSAILHRLQASNSRLLASLSAAERRPRANMMDQGDFQMQLLPVDIDIDWSLLEDDWSFG